MFTFLYYKFILVWLSSVGWDPVDTTPQMIYFSGLGKYRWGLKHCIPLSNKLDKSKSYMEFLIRLTWNNIEGPFQVFRIAGFFNKCSSNIENNLWPLNLTWTKGSPSLGQQVRYSFIAQTYTKIQNTDKKQHLKKGYLCHLRSGTQHWYNMAYSPKHLFLWPAPFRHQGKASPCL